MARKAVGRASKRERDASRLLEALADFAAPWLAEHHHQAKVALGADWRERIDAMRRSNVAKGRVA